MLLSTFCATRTDHQLIMLSSIGGSLFPMEGSVVCLATSRTLRFRPTGPPVLLHRTMCQELCQAVRVAGE